MLSSMFEEIGARFLIGGAVVSIFSAIAEVVRPKSFAGLFGAAPSIALATLGITIAEHGRAYAAMESRSMVLGAIAFLVYAAVVSRFLVRHKTRTLATTAALLPLWLFASFALWFVAYR
jgi:hypothetical protein